MLHTEHPHGIARISNIIKAVVYVAVVEMRTLERFCPGCKVVVLSTLSTATPSLRTYASFLLIAADLGWNATLPPVGSGLEKKDQPSKNEVPL